MYSSFRSKVNLVTLLVVIFAICLASIPFISVNSTAHAATPSIMVTPSSEAPTLPEQVSGTNFGSNEQVVINFDTSKVGTASTNSNGAFSTTITVPSNAQPGTHIIQAIGQRSGLSAQASLLVQTDWFMFGYRAKHTHFNPYENTLNTSNVSQLVLDWKYYTKGKIYASPVIGNGVVYVGSTSFLYAFNAATGSVLWTAASDQNLGFSSAAVVSGVVYAGADKLYAFNAATGTLLWTTRFIGAAYFENPMVYNNVVYIGSEDNNLYAFSATTGAFLWKAPTGSNIVSSPATDNNVVYISSTDGKVYAFAAKTGAQLWSTSVGGTFLRSSPSVENGIVYIGSDNGKLYALNATTGAVLWTATTGTFLISSSPAIANGIVYIGSSRSRIDAYNVTTGKLIWSYTAKGASLVDCSPSVANGVVYFGASNNTIYAVDALKGTMLWKYVAVGAFTYSSPAITNGMVYIGSGTGNHNMWAFHLPSKVH